MIASSAVSFSDEREAITKLKDLIAELPAGTNQSGLICPWCGGGPSHEKSFSLTRTTTEALYMCHRASCIAKGRIGSPAKHFAPIKLPHKAGTPQYWGDLRVLNENEYEILLSRWCITRKAADAIGIRWAPNEPSESGAGRLYIPLRDDQSVTWGAVLRALDNSKPKSLTYIFNNLAPNVAWFKNWQGNGSKLVYVVEDPLSAIRLSRVGSAVALLGTHLNLDVLKDLRVHYVNNPYHRIILALDKDATVKAVELAVKHRSVVPLTVTMLPQDVKNMTTKEFEQFVISTIPNSLLPRS